MKDNTNYPRAKLFPSEKKRIKLLKEEWERAYLGKGATPILLPKGFKYKPTGIIETKET